MWEHIEIDRHYIGVFNILGEEITGEIIYNKQKGFIVLNLNKAVTEDEFCGGHYANLEIITGKVNTGAVITLFNNHCVRNHTQAGSTQNIQYFSQKMIWSGAEKKNSKFNKLTCILNNALRWSRLTAVDISVATNSLKIQNIPSYGPYNLYGAKISFSTQLHNELFDFSKSEERKVIEHLVVEIESDEQKNIEYFLNIQNKIRALISFAIKDNVNIDEQYFYDYNEFYFIGHNTKQYKKHTLLTSENYNEYNETSLWEYNFTLPELSINEKTANSLEKLVPIFNLYLSLFKYQDMPTEMIFLNIVQALETFHSRFFYDNKKDKYVESVKSRFEHLPNYSDLEKLLLSTTQIDENCSYIILVSRLNDLFIGQYDGLFYEFYGDNPNYAQMIADTRHYYTHYGESKKDKALTGEALQDAIYILRLLLEYNVCLILGVDIKEKIKRALKNYFWRKKSDEQANNSLEE